jgi:hypothetical protein
MDFTISAIHPANWNCEAPAKAAANFGGSALNVVTLRPLWTKTTVEQKLASARDYMMSFVISTPKPAPYGFQKRFGKLAKDVAIVGLVVAAVLAARKGIAMRG